MASRICDAITCGHPIDQEAAGELFLGSDSALRTGLVASLPQPVHERRPPQSHPRPGVDRLWDKGNSSPPPVALTDVVHTGTYAQRTSGLSPPISKALFTALFRNMYREICGVAPPTCILEQLGVRLSSGE